MAAASSRIHALIKFGGISSANSLLVPSNTARFSNSQLSPLKSLFFGSSSSRRFYSNPASFEFEQITNLNDAYDCFDQMMRPSRILLSNLLYNVTKSKYYSASLDMFNEMCAVGVPVNESIIRTAIECYSGLYDTQKVFMLLGFCIKRNSIELTDWTHYDSMLEGFVQGDGTHYAEKLFKKFIKHKLFQPYVEFTYLSVIKGLCKTGNHFKAIALLRLMDGRGRKYDSFSYNTIIDSLCKDMMIDDAFRLMKIFHKDISPDLHTYNSLLYALSMSGRWNEVCRILKQMHNIIHGTTFHILIKALCKQGKMKEAEIVDFMMVHIAPYRRHIVTYTLLIDGYCLNGELNRAMSTLESMVRDDVNPTCYIYNRLLDGFSTLDDMKFWLYKRDLDSMYGRAGWDIKENSVTRYIWYRERMEKHCDVPMQNPKYSVYMLCLMDHCDKYEVDAALDLFYFMDGKQLNSNTEVYNILIECTSKCGRFDISRRLFHDLFVKGLEPNLDTYVLMIRGFCERGLLKDAKKLFLKMEESGLQPRSIIKDDDIIQGYTETKPVDDVTKLFIETKRGGYNKRVDECFKFVTEYFFKPI